CLRMCAEDIGRFAVRRFEFPGLDIRTRQTRWYPNGELAVHALGYVGAISEQDLKHIDRAAYAGTSLMGKLGVESAYERELHGTNGFREVLVNAQGRSVERQGAFVPNLRTRAPGAGEALLLSIDLKLHLTSHVGSPMAHRHCAGSFDLPGSCFIYREYHHEHHGAVDLDDAIARSCDVYFYGLANEIGVDRMSTFMGPFGFGKPTGIDIGG